MEKATYNDGPAAPAVAPQEDASVYQQALEHYRKFYAEKTTAELEIIARHVTGVRDGLETQRRQALAQGLHTQEAMRVVNNWMWTLGRTVAIEELRQAAAARVTAQRMDLPPAEVERAIQERMY